MPGKKILVLPEEVQLTKAQMYKREWYISMLFKYGHQTEGRMSLEKFAVYLELYEGQTKNISSTFHRIRMFELGILYPFSAKKTRIVENPTDFYEMGAVCPARLIQEELPLEKTTDETQQEVGYNSLVVDETTTDKTKYFVNDYPFPIFANTPEEAEAHFRFLTNL